AYVPRPRDYGVTGEQKAEPGVSLPCSAVFHFAKKMIQRIRGVLALVVTPFKADLSPDGQRLIAHCKWLLSQNCGLAPFGTTSEANSLAAEERATLLDSLVAAGINTSPMMPGTGCCSITEIGRASCRR